MQKYSIEGVRGQILDKIASIMANHKNTNVANNGNKYAICVINNDQIDQCSLGIVLLENGYVVETYFPNQTDVYNRVWMCDPYIGRVTYIETSNPDLMNTKIAKLYPQSTHLELHAMPEDLDLLNNILELGLKDNANFYSAQNPDIKFLQLKQYI